MGWWWCEDPNTFDVITELVVSNEDAAKHFSDDAIAMHRLFTEVYGEAQ